MKYVTFLCILYSSDRDVIGRNNLSELFLALNIHGDPYIGKSACFAVRTVGDLGRHAEECIRLTATVPFFVKVYLFGARDLLGSAL